MLGPELTAVLDAIDQPATVSRDGRVVYANPAFARTPDLRDVAAVRTITVDGAPAELTLYVEPARLDATERYLSAVIESEPECVKTVSADGVLLSMNPAGLAMVEAESASEVVGRNMLDLIVPEHREAYLRHHAAVIRGERRVFEFDIVGLRGTRRHMESHGAPLVTSTGVLHLAVTRDITERTRVFEELRRSRDIHEKLLAATNDVAWEWDLTTGTIIWNEQMTRVFGHPRDLDIERWGQKLHADDRRRVWDSLDRAIAAPEGTLWTEEYRFRRADGSFATVMDRGIVLFEGGRPVRMVGVMMDVTDERDLQARLSLADRMASLGTLAAGVAHEINNPLAFVQANLRYTVDALEGGADPSSLRRALEDACEGADRVEQIVRDLRTLSRPDDRVLGPVDVTRAIESAITMAWNEIRHRAQLVRRFEGALMVVADPAQLAQVFLNLLVNAAQAIPEGAADRNVISVEARRYADDVVVTVTDTGCGIPREHLRRIFDPFFTTKPVGVGTGLGLSISHRTIVALGGSIIVESEVDAGTMFRIRLPAAEVTDVGPAPEAVAAAPPRSLRVAIVDDEPMILRALERVLPDYDIITFERARDAIAWLDGGEPCDVVLCDLMMPEMTGIELHAWMRETRPDLAERTIFLTGGAFTAAAASFVEAHATRCLDKPVDLPALRARIEAVVTRA